MNRMDNAMPPSPCVRNCCLDDDEICLGCFRSLEEIMAWSGADADQRRAILQNTEQRRDECGRKKTARG